MQNFLLYSSKSYWAEIALNFRKGATKGGQSRDKSPTPLTFPFVSKMYLTLYSISHVCPLSHYNPGAANRFQWCLTWGILSLSFFLPRRVNGSFCLPAQISCLNTEWDLYPEKALLFSFQKANWWASQAGVRGGSRKESWREWERWVRENIDVILMDLWNPNDCSRLHQSNKPLVCPCLHTTTTTTKEKKKPINH